MKVVWLAALTIAVGACERPAQNEPSAIGSDPSRTMPPAAPDTAAPQSDPLPESLSEPAAELRLSLDRMLRGESAQAGEVSWFSPATADVLRSVAVDSAGHAIADFEDLTVLIPNASSSAGSAILLEELNATVFAVAGIQSVEYRIEGSCARFWEWLQYDCQVVDRP